MSLADDLDGTDDLDLVRAELKIASRDRRIRDLEAAVRALTKQLEDSQAAAEFGRAVIDGDRPAPKWLTPARRKKTARHATVGLMLSDLHLDEVVRAAEMNDVNAYDRRIAELRLAKVIDTTVMLVGEIFPTLTIDGAVVLWAGDVFSGIIHQELRETNDAPLLDSIRHWEPIIAGAFTRLADAFGKVHVPVVCGNHGRLSIKPVAKGRARDNVEWLLAHMLAKTLAGDRRITFDIPESADMLVQVYDSVVRLEHGDGFKGGSGIAGAMSPLLLGVHRATRQAMAEGRPFDVMAVGHWHQYIVAPSKGLVVNGSLKGYDEYARRMKFEPEPAQQAFWLWTPEHGISFSAPILAVDRKAEGW